MIDGKTVRGSRDGYHGNPAIHLIHAWSVENGICLGKWKTRDKSNELTAIPELFDILCIEGAIITIDAMGAQTVIAETVEVVKGHGRVETRRCAVFESTDRIRENHKWKGMRTIVKMT